MKRAQMIEAMVASLWGETPLTLTNEEIAQRMLSACEEAGMIPPRTNLPYTYDIEDNAWEDE